MQLKIISSLFIAVLLGAVCVSVSAPAARARPGPRVAIQAGHWRAREAPLRISTGGSVNGVHEWAIDLDVAQRVAVLLRAAGIEAEVLPAWFPAGYAADAFVSLHVNGSPNPDHRGFFAERAEDSVIPAVEDRLVRLINSVYGEATGIPYIYRPTRDSRRYYGYYRVTGSTPAVLVEMGFLTNDTDRAFLTGSPQTAAQALATAIRRFLADTPPASPGPAATPGSPPTRLATIRSDLGRSARLREQPTRRSPVLAVIPQGSEIAIAGTSTGEAVDPGNSTWYVVRWQGRQGYVYAGLVDLKNGD